MLESWLRWSRELGRAPVGDVLEICDDGQWPRLWAERFAQRLAIGIDAFDARIAAAELPAAHVRDAVEEEYWRLLGDAVGAHHASSRRH